jgi:hypothetical protein
MTICTNKEKIILNDDLMMGLRSRRCLRENTTIVLGTRHFLHTTPDYKPVEKVEEIEGGQRRGTSMGLARDLLRKLQAIIFPSFLRGVDFWDNAMKELLLGYQAPATTAFLF